MAISKEESKQIRESLVNEVSNDISAIWPPKTLTSFIGQINSLIKEIDIFQQRWENRIQVRKNYLLQEGKAVSSATGIAWAALVQQQKDNDMFYYDTLKIISKVELYLDKVRNLFVGDKNAISYTFGFLFGGEVHEYQLSLEEMLKQARIGIDSTTKGLKLFMSRGRKDMLTTFRETKRNLAGSSNLFLSLIDFYNKNTKTILKGEKKVKITGVFGRGKTQKRMNFGQLYELYRYLVEVEGWSQEKYFNETTDSRIFYKVKRRIMNSISGRKGGDINNSQIKFYNASFGFLDTAQRDLNKIINILNKFKNTSNKQELKQAILNLFTKKGEKTLTKIEKESIKIAEENIKNLLNDSFILK